MAEHPLILPRRSFLGLCLGTLAALPSVDSWGQAIFRDRNYRVRIAIADKVKRLALRGAQDYSILNDAQAVVGRLRTGEPYFIDIVEGQPGAKTYRLVLRELDAHQVAAAIALAQQAKESYKLPVKVFRIPSREPDGGRILVTLGEFATLDEARAETRKLGDEKISLIYEDRATAVRGEVRLLDRDGRIIARDPKRLRVSPLDPADGDLAIDRTTGDALSAAGLGTARRYRGDLDLMINEDGSLTAVNDLWVEHYLYSVVGAEIGDDSPDDALMAQAVAGRSEAVAKIERHFTVNSQFDFYDTAIAQSYPGRKSETAGVRSAVDRTRGEILVWQGGAVDAVYSHSCGGCVACSTEVWGGTGEGYSQIELDRLTAAKTPDFSTNAAAYDFLSSAAPSLCNPNQKNFPNYAKKYYRWEKRYSGAEYSKLADDLYGVGDVKDVTVDVRTPSGRVTKMRIIGDKKAKTIDRELEIRRALGDAYSTLVAISKDTDGRGMLKSLKILGGGWGHGVGMCQMGALMMSYRGYNYRQILAHYYDDVKIRRLYR